jgi:hypothetical protein
VLAYCWINSFLLSKVFFEYGPLSSWRDAKINIVVDKIQFQTRCENMTDCGNCACFLDEEDAIIWQYIF